MPQTPLLGWAGWARGQIIGIRRAHRNGGRFGYNPHARIPTLVAMEGDLREADATIARLKMELAGRDARIAELEAELQDAYYEARDEG